MSARAGKSDVGVSGGQAVQSQKGARSAMLTDSVSDPLLRSDLLAWISSDLYQQYWGHRSRLTHYGY